MPRKKTVKIVDDSNKDLFGWIRPEYNEITLLLMALTSIFLFIGSPALRTELRFVYSFGTCLSPIVIVFFIIGLLLSLVHPFISGKKSYFEKTAMVLFVMAANGGAGLYAGWKSLSEFDSRYLVFPIINILFFFFVSISVVGGSPDESISDDDVDPYDAVVSAVLLFGIFLFCIFVLKPHWTIVFSICIGYSTLAHRVIKRAAPLVKRFLLRVEKN